MPFKVFTIEKGETFYFTIIKLSANMHDLIIYV